MAAAGRRSPADRRRGHRQPGRQPGPDRPAGRPCGRARPRPALRAHRSTTPTSMGRRGQRRWQTPASRTRSPSAAREDRQVEDALGAVQSVLVLGGTSEIAAAIIRRLVAARRRPCVLAAPPVPPMPSPWPPSCGRSGPRWSTSSPSTPPTSGHQDAGGRRRRPPRRPRPGHPRLRRRSATRPSSRDDPAGAADLVATNLGGAVSAGLAVAAQLRRQGHGTLLVLSSVAGVRARTRQLRLRRPPRPASTPSPRASATPWSAPGPGSWWSAPASSTPG